VSLQRLSSPTINEILLNHSTSHQPALTAMYPALDEELEVEQSLPLTGVNCAEIDEALKSLSEFEMQSSARTFDETRKLLKQVRKRGACSCR